MFLWILLKEIPMEAPACGIHLYNVTGLSSQLYWINTSLCLVLCKKGIESFVERTGCLNSITMAWHFQFWRFCPHVFFFQKPAEKHVCTGFQRYVWAQKWRNSRQHKNKTKRNKSEELHTPSVCPKHIKLCGWIYWHLMKAQHHTYFVVKLFTNGKVILIALAQILFCTPVLPESSEVTKVHWVCCANAVLLYALGF